MKLNERTELSGRKNRVVQNLLKLVILSDFEKISTWFYIAIMDESSTG